MSMIYLQIIIAAFMASVNILIIYDLKNTRNTTLGIYISGMMGLMNILGYAIITHSAILPVIFINAAYMSFGLFPVLTKKELQRKTGVLVFGVVMVLSEIAMGAFFIAWTENHGVGLEQAVENPWFAYVMLSEMAFSALYRNKDENRKILRTYFSSQRNYLFAFLAMMALMPISFPNNAAYVIGSIWETAVIMILSTVLIYETLYRQRLRKTQETSMSLEMMILFTIMMIGEFTYFIYSTWIIFDIAVVAGMVWFIYRATGGKPDTETNYLSDQKWSFSFIALTFVMEWFMGAVLAIAAGYLGRGVSGFTASLFLPWQSGGYLSYPIDLFNLFVSVTASPWFLIMMGTEMGILAVSKLFGSHNRENRVRIALMIGAYFIYSIYLPSFSSISSDLPRIPYMWSMGIGTLGPVTSGVLFIGIIGTYVVSASLSLLFGSRQVCSVTCTAPLMYQGTFYDSLKIYNRTSSLGKKTLTSKIKPWFRFSVISVSIFVLFSAVISYLNSVGVITFTILGTDMSVLVYTLWFNLLWYVVFVSIPFMGTYACVTQGWCYWGTFNQMMGYLGFFRLKVKDANTCATCKTVDCASACPVGLTDMRASFIKKGSFKAFKCVGVGDCVEACPYDNIFFYDVRGFVKERISHNPAKPKGVIDMESFISNSEE